MINSTELWTKLSLFPEDALVGFFLSQQQEKEQIQKPVRQILMKTTYIIVMQSSDWDS